MGHTDHNLLQAQYEEMEISAMFFFIHLANFILLALCIVSCKVLMTNCCNYSILYENHLFLTGFIVRNTVFTKVVFSKIYSFISEIKF